MYDPGATSGPCEGIRCESLDTTRDRFGTVGCATCRYVSWLVATVIVELLTEMVHEHDDIRARVV